MRAASFALLAFLGACSPRPSAAPPPPASDAKPAAEGANVNAAPTPEDLKKKLNPEKRVP